LNRNHKTEVQDRSKIYKTQQTKRRQLQEQMDSLVDMRTRNLLDDEEYVAQRHRIKSEMLRLDEHLRGTELRADEWLELTEKAFDFATYARIRFQNGDISTKRQILTTLGQNFTLKDQRLSLTTSAWLVPIGENYAEIEAEYLRRVGTNKNASSSEALVSVSENWRAIRDSNPGHPA
jgi:hypothetical protein